MYLLPSMICWLALDLVSAHQIPQTFRSSKRQNEPNDKDLQVNIHPDPAKALSEFLKLETTTDSCRTNASPASPSASVAGNTPSKRQNTGFPTTGRALAKCLAGIGKAVVPALADGRALRSVITYAKDITVNLDLVKYADPEVQEASAEFMIYGADTLQTISSTLSPNEINTVLEAIWAAQYATIVNQVGSLGYFQIAKELLNRQSDTNTCPKTTSGNDNGQVDCVNPLCDGKNGICQRPVLFHGCPCSSFVCPTGDDTPYCDLCGGDTGQKKCKGLADKNNKYQYCNCMVSEAPGPWIDSEHPWYDLSKIIDTNSSSSADYLKCSENKDKFVYWERAKAAVEDYCNNENYLSVQGATPEELGKGKVNDGHYNVGIYDDMNVRVTWFENEIITKDVCSQMFTDIVDKCDVNEEDKHGGSYTLQKSGSTDKILIAEIIPNGSHRKSTSQCANKGDDFAPKKDVYTAIDQWCAGIDQRKLEINQRFPISRLGVDNRASFWLRVVAHPDCPSLPGVEECKQVLRDGMDQCDPGSDNTYGHTTQADCADYSIFPSGITDDTATPWANIDPKFPPPEFEHDTAPAGGYPYVPLCATNLPDGRAVAVGRPLLDSDLEAAISAVCQDGAEIKGFGKYGKNQYKFPSSAPYFYSEQRLKMFLNVGLETVNNGATPPYGNMDWCKNYDWKMGRDDCTYALRSIFQKCALPDKFVPADYTYRCVHYHVGFVNCEGDNCKL